MLQAVPAPGARRRFYCGQTRRYPFARPRWAFTWQCEDAGLLQQELCDPGYRGAFISSLVFRSFLSLIVEMHPRPDVERPVASDPGSCPAFRVPRPGSRRGILEGSIGYRFSSVRLSILDRPPSLKRLIFDHVYIKNPLPSGELDSLICIYPPTFHTGSSGLLMTG